MTIYKCPFILACVVTVCMDTYTSVCFSVSIVTICMDTYTGVCFSVCI